MPTPADAGNRELEAAIDGLYQGPLDQFTSERNVLAASLKKNGDKVSAERVKALAKPSSTAWAVNQAWWHHRERFQAMLDAGAAQRKAHIAFAQGRPTDVRAAGEARRQAVSEVTEAALQALGGHKAVAPDVQYRIAGTVEALASSGVPEGESPGRLTRDLQSSGLDALTALAEAAGSITRPTIVARGTPAESTPPRAPAIAHRKETPAAPRGTGPEPAATESARERKAREAQEAAERTRAGQLTEARTRASQSGAALEAATQAASESAAEETSARAALEAAAKRRVDLEAALDEARAEEAAARRALSSATAAASRAELDRARADRDAARAREALERLEAGN